MGRGRIVCFPEDAATVGLEPDAVLQSHGNVGVGRKRRRRRLSPLSLLLLLLLLPRLMLLLLLLLFRGFVGVFNERLFKGFHEAPSLFFVERVSDTFVGRHIAVESLM